MYKDIFDVARSTIGRQSPIVTALLYSFCPSAAHWYVKNVTPEDVCDLVWKAFEDYASGKSMVECVEGYGLGPLIPDVKKYIEQVQLFRSRNSVLGNAPELSPLFKGDRASQSVFGLRAELKNVGGSWKSMLSYIRVWAFLMRDWKAEMKIPSGHQTQREFKKFIVSLSAPGDYSRSKVHFPVWGWDVTQGKVQNTYLGLLVSGQRQDALRFALVHDSDLVGDKGWPGQRPYVFSLDRDRGSANPLNLSIERKDALSAIIKMYECARSGPNLPLALLRDRDACLSCGYKKTCYGDKGKRIMPAVMTQLLYEDKRERDFLAGYRRSAESENRELDEQS